MSLWLAIVLQSASTNSETATFDLARSAKPTAAIRFPRCKMDDAPTEDVVVCGLAKDHYRLPLPAERAPLPGAVRGEAQSGMAALTASGRCGVFAGERRCVKREAAEYGYGEGRDPITLVSRLAQKAVDPDAD